MNRLAPQRIIQAAENLLKQYIDGQVRLTFQEICSEGDVSLVLRCAVTALATELPGSIVIKVAREAFGPYIPNSVASSPAMMLFNDWAAYQFLSSRPEFSNLAPRFYGGDRDYGLIVLEDLHDIDSPNTYETLLGNSPDRAEEALVEHVALLGRLHGITQGHCSQYQALRQDLGPLPLPEKPFQGPWMPARLSPFPPETIYQAIQCYRDCFAFVGIAPRPGINSEIETVVQTVEVDPGLFLALCQGDMDNARQCHRGRDGLRLLDFGAGGFRHALIEGMPGRINWGCTLGIPKQVVLQMEKAYFDAWSRNMPVAIHVEAFRQAMAHAGGRCHLFHVLSRVPDALKADRERGLSTLRQQVIAWLKAFADLAEETGMYPALRTSAQLLAERLKRLWPSECHELPCYPAFQ